MNLEAPQEPVLLVPKGLVWVILVALGLTAGAAVFWPGGLSPLTRPSLRLSGWCPSPEELSQIESRRLHLLESQRIKDKPRIALELAIQEGLTHWLATEQRLGYEGAREDAQARLALAKTEEAMRTLVLGHGKDAARALAVGWARELRRRLVSALAEMQAKHLDFGTIATTDVQHETLKKLESFAPGVARALAQAGVDRLLLDPVLRPAAVLVVEALAEQRMLQLCQRVPGPRLTLASDLARLLLRFRVEAHSGLTLQRRLQLLEQLASEDASYPATYVTAVLLARAGKWRAAKMHFELAAQRDQLPSLARANARLCRERLRLQVGH